MTHRDTRVALRRLDAHRIHPLLWQGSYPGDALDEVGRNFQAVVLCADELPGRGFERRLPPSCAVLRVPLDDCVPPRPGHLERSDGAAAQVAGLMKHGFRVLVTCQAGRNRSGLVSAQALRYHTGKPGYICAEIVRRARPLALTNLSFYEYVCALP